MASSFVWERRYWSDPDFEGCGPYAKALYIYLSGSMHTNILGMCKVSLHRLREETEFTADQVQKAVSKLVAMGKIEVDSALNLYWVKASLKRESKLSQDRFFKGVVKEIFSLPSHPISTHFLKHYADLLKGQKTDKCYTAADQARLLSILKKIEDPSMAHQEPYMAAKAKARDRDLNSSLDQEETSIASSVPENPNPGEQDPVSLVLGYLNQQAGKRFSTTSKPNRSFVSARLETHTLQDCFEVIDKKVAEWKGTDNDKYLRPETLFNATKFESYFNQQSPAALKAAAAAAESKPAVYIPRY